MRDNSTRRRISDGAVAIGSVITIPDLVLVEVMGATDVDFLIVETEHSAIGVGQLQTMLIALGTSASSVFVRVPHLDIVSVKQALDIGAEGIIVPNVSTADQCRQLVDMVRYFPMGSRGLGPRRASRLHGDRNDYLRRANEEVLAMPMIESAEAVDNIEAMLQVPGIDAVILGPYDLAATMGHMMEVDHPDVDKSLMRVRDACLDVGVPFGIFTSTEPLAAKWIERGAQLVTIGSDLQYIDTGVAATTAAVKRCRGYAAI